MKLITPPGMLVTVAVLAIYTVYAAWSAYLERSWIFGVAALAALAACVGTAMLRPWSRFLVYLLVAGVVGGWVSSMYAARQAGYFSLFAPYEVARSLAPGTVIMLLSLACAYIVFRHFRKETAREAQG